MRGFYRHLFQQKFIFLCRAHAEFQINEPPNFPFWFSPAQFTGRIIISKDGSHVEDFTFYVPNDKKLNVGRFELIFLMISQLLSTITSQLLF